MQRTPKTILFRARVQRSKLASALFQCCSPRLSSCEYEPSLFQIPQQCAEVFNFGVISFFLGPSRSCDLSDSYKSAPCPRQTKLPSSEIPKREMSEATTLQQIYLLQGISSLVIPTSGCGWWRIGPLYSHGCFSRKRVEVTRFTHCDHPWSKFCHFVGEEFLFLY